MRHRIEEDDPSPDSQEDDSMEKLTKQPVIIAIICLLAAIVVILLIVAIYLFCRRNKRKYRHRRCHGTHAYGYDNREFERWPYPPPNYYAPEENYQPERRHYPRHNYGIDDDVAFPTYRYFEGYNADVHVPPYREYEHYGRHPPRGRSVNEFPLLETPLREVQNPIYDDYVPDDESERQRDYADRLTSLYTITERSFSQVVDGKLVVSIARLVDYHGDTLILDNMGISLKVPKGAVKRGRKQRITLVLNWDLSDNPDMTKEQSLVSPVVYVGPHGLKLEKPCTLSYRHCSYDTRQIRVMRSETELVEDKKWEVLCDKDDKTGMCYLTNDECQLKIDKFTLYTCLQSPVDNNVGKKWLQLAVFACPLRRELNHHQIRVYFLNKTPCALQWAIQNEAGFGGKLVCPEKAFLFDGGEYDMFAVTKYISDGWERVDNDNKDKVSFLNIWHGQCPHVSICYRRCPLRQSRGHDQGQGQQGDQINTVAIEMSVRLQTYQDNPQQHEEKIFLQVVEDTVTPVTHNEKAFQEKIEINIRNVISQNMRISNPSSAAVNNQGIGESNKSANSQATSASQQISVNISNITCPDYFLELAERTGPRTVPQDLRHQLALLLNPEKPVTGNNWRQLAGYIGLDGCIPTLEDLKNYTEHILDVFETKNMSLDQLKSFLQTMEREDCVQAIDDYSRGTGTEVTREPVESSYQSQCLTQQNVSSQTSWDENTRQTTSSNSIGVDNSIPKTVYNPRTSINTSGPGVTYHMENDVQQNWSFRETNGHSDRDHTDIKESESSINRTGYSGNENTVTRSSSDTYELNNLSNPRYMRNYDRRFDN